MGDYSSRPAFTEKSYHKKFKGLFIRTFLSYLHLKSNHFLRAYLEGVDGFSKQVLFYLLAKDEIAEKYLKEQLGGKKFEVLQILFKQFNVIAPLCFSKTYLVDYGSSNRPHHYIAKPYAGNNRLSEGSDFGDIDVLLFYTVMKHMKEGISCKQMSYVIQRLVRDAEKECYQDSSKMISQTAAFASFEFLCGEKTSDASFLKFSDVELNHIIKRLHENSHLFFDFLERYILPEVSVHKKKIRCNPHMMLGIFDKECICGFTGTLTHEDTFMLNVPKLGTDLKMLLPIWRSHREKRIRTLQSVSLGKVLDELLKGAAYSKGLQALIDMAPCFRGLNNQKVAEEILIRLPPKFKAVVYYNVQDELFILNRNKESKPLAESSLDHSVCFNYFDQVHCEGTDLRHDDGAFAYLIFGKSTQLNDLLQAAWRMVSP